MRLPRPTRCGRASGSSLCGSESGTETAEWVVENGYRQLYPFLTPPPPTRPPTRRAPGPVGLSARTAGGGVATHVSKGRLGCRSRRLSGRSSGLGRRRWVVCRRPHRCQIQTKRPLVFLVSSRKRQPQPHDARRQGWLLPRRHPAPPRLPKRREQARAPPRPPLGPARPRRRHRGAQGSLPQVQRRASAAFGPVVGPKVDRPPSGGGGGGGVGGGGGEGPGGAPAGGGGGEGLTAMTTATTTTTTHQQTTTHPPRRRCGTT